MVTIAFLLGFVSFLGLLAVLYKSVAYPVEMATELTTLKIRMTELESYIPAWYQKDVLPPGYEDRIIRKIEERADQRREAEARLAKTSPPLPGTL